MWLSIWLVECALFWSYLFIFLVLEQSQRQLKVLSIVKQNSILLPEKSGESSLVSRERAKGEGKGGRISEESQRKSSRGPGFLHQPNREPHCLGDRSFPTSKLLSPTLRRLVSDSLTQAGWIWLLLSSLAARGLRHLCRCLQLSP